MGSMENQNEPTQTQQPSVHGHELLHMVMDSQEGHTLDSLKAQITAKFGEDVKFHTCSLAGMPFEHLLYYLMITGKIVEIEGKLRVNPAMICSDAGVTAQHDHE
jgi:probable metal-binding protein